MSFMGNDRNADQRKTARRITVYCVCSVKKAVFSKIVTIKLNLLNSEKIGFFDSSLFVEDYFNI